MIPHHLVTGRRAAARPLELARHHAAPVGGPGQALAEHFTLIRYDTRGHGGTETPPGPYEIDDLGQDVLDLLDHLGSSARTSPASRWAA